MALAVDGPEIALIVRAAMGHGQDVVNFICLANPSQPGAVVAPAQVLVTLEDAVTQPTPWAAATS